MSGMKQLLESMSKFAGEPEQKPGDQVRGHEKAKKKANGQHPFADRLVGGSANESKELEESLMNEYKYFVKEQTPPAANAAPTASSPVANINPAGTGTAATQPAAAPAVPGQQPATGTPAVPGQQPAQAAKPATGTPAAPATGQQPPAGQTAAKPATGAPGAGTATPPNPQQVKQATDTVTKIMNNPADPFNAQLQALLKKAGMVPR